MASDWPGLNPAVHGLADVPDIQEAAARFRAMVVADEFEEFLTLPAYPVLP